MRILRNTGLITLTIASFAVIIVLTFGSCASRDNDDMGDDMGAGIAKHIKKKP